MTPLLVLFEDSHWADLRPLTEILPVPALAFGAARLETRWRAQLGLPLLGIQARPQALAAWHGVPRPDVPQPSPETEVLAINAAALPGAWMAPALEGPMPALWVTGDRVVGARLPYHRLGPGLGRGAGFEDFLRELDLPQTRVGADLLWWPWDIVDRNPEALREDLAGLPGTLEGDVHALAAVLQPDRVRVERGARVDPYAVLDGRSGPILVREGAVILSHTLVTGPCVIGARTELLGGAVGNSTIGPECRIAGEVDACVWQGWANKRHHGFIGHSVISEWVNLGALTTTSDLKNNYGQVRVWVDGREVDSGTHKVGAFIGGHVKTGIGSLLPTGASIGTGSNLFGGGRFAPKHLAPFSWWDGERCVEHALDKFTATARTAMGRRQRTLTGGDEAALRGLFEGTRGERSGVAATVSAPS